MVCQYCLDGTKGKLGVEAAAVEYDGDDYFTLVVGGEFKKCVKKAGCAELRKDGCLRCRIDAYFFATDVGD